MHAQIAQADPVFEAVIHYVDPQAPIGGINDVEREKSTFTLIPHRMRIWDARALQAELGLERTGFVWLKRPTAVRNFADPREVERVFFPEAAALVQELTGADKVVVFGQVQRDGALKASRHAPVYNAHVDYNEETIRAVARRLLAPDELTARLAGRIVLVNVWRPLEVVERSPLALCDASSVVRKDLIFGPIGGNSAAGVPNAAGWNLAHNPDHRWLYVPRMQPDEVLVFKLCDTDRSRPQWTAHCSIDEPDTPANATPRRSIELRTLAFMPAEKEPS
jgi:hypothetical protein